MRCGCLFSQRRKRPIAAQSAIAIQREYARRASPRAPRFEDTAYVENYVAEVLAAREMVCDGAGTPRHRTFPVRRISSCSMPATAPSTSATRCANAASWCATAATKFPAAFASPSARARRAPAFLGGNVAVMERIKDSIVVSTWTACCGGHRILPRSHRADGASTSPGSDHHARPDPGYKNAGGWNNDGRCRKRSPRDLASSVEYRAVVDHFNQIFLGEKRRRPDPRESWIPAAGPARTAAGRFDLAIFTGRLRYEARYSR